jgi:hypothetical protein
MDSLLFDFNKVINKIIENITNDIFFQNNLNYCNYKKSRINNYNQQENNIVYNPIIFCLGGMAYKIYSYIINKYINTDAMVTKTQDYDFSFSLKNNDKTTLINLKNLIIKIFNNSINNYSYILDINMIRYYKITSQTINKNNFSIEVKEKFDRLQFIVNCKIDQLEFHILELSFWYNGKVSDLFTINDFQKNNLMLYIDNNSLCFYLLPLNLLVDTTLHAIINFFENRYFDKCNKYIQRIKYIHNINKKYNTLYNKPNMLINIIGSYNKYIRKKYRLINDYPYNISTYKDKIKDIDNENKNAILRCVYYDMRKENKSILDEKIDQYVNDCKSKINKLSVNKYTEETDDV